MKKAVEKYKGIKESGYNYDEIYEKARKRPEMYFGSKDFRGVRNIIIELVKQCIDCDKSNISVSVDEESISIEYDGEMIPNNWDIDIVKIFSEEFLHEKGILKFRLDKEIYNGYKINNDILFDDLRELAFLNKNISITYKGHRFYYENGLVDLYRYYELKSRYLVDESTTYEICYESDDIDVDIVFGLVNWWNKSDLRTMSYVNNQRTDEHGSHVDGFVDGLKSSLLECQKDCCKEMEDFHYLSYRLVVHIKTEDVHYYGATKEKVDDRIIYKVVNELTKAKMKEIFSENVELAIDCLKCGHCARKSE